MFRKISLNFSVPKSILVPDGCGEVAVVVDGTVDGVVAATETSGDVFSLSVILWINASVVDGEAIFISCSSIGYDPVLATSLSTLVLIAPQLRL